MDSILTARDVARGRGRSRRKQGRGQAAGGRDTEVCGGSWGTVAGNRLPRSGDIFSTMTHGAEFCRKFHLYYDI